MDNCLKPRTHKDYEGQLVSRAKKIEARRNLAIAIAYDELIRVAAQALKRGQSVLVRSSGEISGPFVKSLQTRTYGFREDDFYFSTLQEAISYTPYVHSEGVVEQPSRKMLTESFQRQLVQGEGRDRIGVLDFLDPFLSLPNENSTDLLYILTAYPEAVFLAFALPDTPLPPFLHDRLAVHMNLPPLLRKDVWSLMAYQEVQNILGANTLSVSHQVALYHAVAGLDALKFRKLIEILLHENEPLTQPSEAIAQIKSWLAFGRLVDPIPSLSVSQQVVERLTDAIVAPLRKCEDTEVSGEEVQNIEAQIPLGVMLVGDAHISEDLARWLAGEVRACWFEIPAVELHPKLLDRIPVFPAVLFVSDVEEAALTGSGSLLSFLSAWERHGAQAPVILIAHSNDPVALKTAVRRRFTLELTT
jgi:hypothetical protein